MKTKVDEELLSMLVRDDCRNGCHVCHDPFVLGEEIGFSAVSDVHRSPIMVHARCAGKKPGAYITAEEIQ